MKRSTTDEERRKSIQEEAKIIIKTDVYDLQTRDFFHLQLEDDESRWATHPMTQVVTVSPATAAYASEAYKQKHPKSTPMEAAISAWHQKAVSSGDPSDLGLLNAVRPPALALAFLTSGNVHHFRPITVSQAISEYAAHDGNDTNAKEAANSLPEVSAGDAQGYESIGHTSADNSGFAKGSPE